MSEDSYRKLAERLDTIPNGFPATESGVELRLLAKLFTPEEAALAAVMRLTREPAADIAARAGVDADTAYRTLKRMARKGLIQAGRGAGQFSGIGVYAGPHEEHLTFGLMPYAVGFIEEQLPRLDAELAALLEQHGDELKADQETQEDTPRDTLPFHRVIPVEEAIPFELEVFAYERAVELLENAKAWSVRDCICRVQQRLVGKGCDHEIENCLIFSSVENAFDHTEVGRAITREEALRILHETEEAGLVHSTGNYRGGNFYICNCCTCCCAVLRGAAEASIPTAIIHSDFRAVVDEELCLGCEDCVDRCQFGALAVRGDACQVDHARCVGCGSCVMICPNDALRLERRPVEEAPLTPPANLRAWMTQRADERGIPLDDIL